MLDVDDLLRGALTPPKEKNRAALTRSDDIAGLLRAIEGYQGNVSTRAQEQDRHKGLGAAEWILLA